MRGKKVFHWQKFGISVCSMHIPFCALPFHSVVYFNAQKNFDEIQVIFSSFFACVVFLNVLEVFFFFF